jgi:hypothetical protein
MLIAKKKKASIFLIVLALAATSLAGCASLPSKSQTQSSSASIQTQSSSMKSSSTSSGADANENILVQSTVKITKPQMDYIVGWLNKDTLLYSDVTNNISTLRKYTPKTGEDSAFLAKSGANIVTPAVSPDGTHLAYGVMEPNNGTEDLCVMNLKSRTIQTLYKGIGDLEWADNNRILFTAGGSNPLLTDLSGHITNLTKIIGWSKGITYRYGPIVGNDLYYLASETMQVPADLCATDLTTGSKSLIEKNVDTFYFSPDHQYAFAEVTLGTSSTGSQTAFELINPEGQVECTIRKNNNSTGREGVAYNVTWSPDGRFFTYTISTNDKDNAGLYIYDTKRNSSTKIESNVFGLAYWNPVDDNLAITYTIGSDNAYSSVFKIYYMTRVAGS